MRIICKQTLNSFYTVNISLRVTAVKVTFTFVQSKVRIKEIKRA